MYKNLNHYLFNRTDADYIEFGRFFELDYRVNGTIIVQNLYKRKNKGSEVCTCCKMCMVKKEDQDVGVVKQKLIDLMIGDLISDLVTADDLQVTQVCEDLVGSIRILSEEIDNNMKSIGTRSQIQELQRYNDPTSVMLDMTAKVRNIHMMIEECNKALIMVRYGMLEATEHEPMPFGALENLGVTSQPLEGAGRNHTLLH